MARSVKMCDVSAKIAAMVFKELNPGQIELIELDNGEVNIVTDIEPIDLVYPEGWYYAQGKFRNNHKSIISINYATMLNSKNELWQRNAPYTLPED